MLVDKPVGVDALDAAASLQNALVRIGVASMHTCMVLLLSEEAQFVIQRFNWLKSG